MPKFHVEWKFNLSAMPEDPAKMVKIRSELLEMVKADVKLGKMVDWGSYCNGYNGYMIFEGNQDELMPELLKYTPHILFDVKPIINVDQAIDAVKALYKMKTE
jgi:hypothetical protein